MNTSSPADLREEAKLLNEMANGIGLTSKQRKRLLAQARLLKEQARQASQPRSQPTVETAP